MTLFYTRTLYKLGSWIRREGNEYNFVCSVQQRFVYAFLPGTVTVVVYDK